MPVPRAHAVPGSAFASVAGVVRRACLGLLLVLSSAAAFLPLPQPPLHGNLRRSASTGQLVLPSTRAFKRFPVHNLPRSPRALAPRCDTPSRETTRVKPGRSGSEDVKQL